MTSLEHRKRVLAFQQEQERKLIPPPSLAAMHAALEVEAEDRRQCSDPDEWMEWTPAYRMHIARKIEACFNGRK